MASANNACPANGRLITLICRLYGRSWRRWRWAARDTEERREVAEGADDGTRGWASGSRATTVHNHVMRLSCQLRKYLSQFVACNGFALLDPWLYEGERKRERPPSDQSDLLQPTCWRLPTREFPSLFLFISIFSLILYFLPVSSISPVRMPTEEQRKKADCHAQKPRQRGGNVLLAVTFDHSTLLVTIRCIY